MHSTCCARRWLHLPPALTLLPLAPPCALAHRGSFVGTSATGVTGGFTCRLLPCSRALQVWEDRVRWPHSYPCDLRSHSASTACAHTWARQNVRLTTGGCVHFLVAPLLLGVTTVGGECARLRGPVWAAAAARCLVRACPDAAYPFARRRWREKKM